MNFYTHPPSSTSPNESIEPPQQTLLSTSLSPTPPSSLSSSSNTSNKLKRCLKLEFSNPNMNQAVNGGLSSNMSNTTGALTSTTASLGISSQKRLRLSSPMPLTINVGIASGGLSSPDLKKLNLSSPELEKFIRAEINATQTPTPSQITFSPIITNEQQQQLDVKGFEDVLASLKMAANNGEIVGIGNSGVNIMSSFGINTSTASTGGSAIVSMTSSTNSGSSSSSSVNNSIKNELLINENSVECGRCSSNSSCATYATLESNQYPHYELHSQDGSTIHIKEEPNASLSSPPMLPIDMEEQEKSKLDRKRLRNRIAASKCRKRKLERIARLEKRVIQLKTDNSELAGVASKLKEEVCALKEQVMQHVQDGCQINCLPM